MASLRPSNRLPLQRLARWLLALLFAAALQAAAAALEPRQQVMLDQAVMDHAEGRLPVARRAFESLARRGVPAAAYNLGVMHLEGQLPDANLERRQVAHVFAVPPAQRPARARSRSRRSPSRRPPSSRSSAPPGRSRSR